MAALVSYYFEASNQKRHLAITTGTQQPKQWPPLAAELRFNRGRVRAQRWEAAIKGTYKLITRTDSFLQNENKL